MFRENFRVEAMTGGQGQILIPYPKISEEDSQKWKAFLQLTRDTFTIMQENPPCK